MMDLKRFIQTIVQSSIGKGMNIKVQDANNGKFTRLPCPLCAHVILVTPVAILVDGEKTDMGSIVCGGCASFLWYQPDENVCIPMTDKDVEMLCDDSRIFMERTRAIVLKGKKP